MAIKLQKWNPLWRIVVGAAWILALGGCETAPSHSVRVSDYPGTIRVACIGDSITYGAGVENREQNNYPAVLSKLLGPKYVVRNFGVSGATLLKQGDKPYWDQPEFKDATAFQPHVIVIKLGTNDSKPQNWRYQNDFPNDLRAMIDHFRSLPSRPKLWLCYPVPVYDTRWGINPDAVKNQIVPIIKFVAWERGVPIIDLYTALRGHPEYFPDRIHPNAAGAAVIAGTVHAALMGKSR